MVFFSRFLVLLTTLIVINGQTYSYDETDQLEALEWHNNERSTTAAGNEQCSSGSPNTFDTTCPSGTLYKLRWDRGLAQVAQDYAESISSSCTFAHSSSSWRSTQMLNQESSGNTDIDYTSGEWIGENLAASWSSGSYPTGTGVYSGWVDDESGIYQYGNDEPQTCVADDCNSGNGQIGHYTQVVADRSRYLGCGFAGNECDGWYRSTVVCMYYPGGNFNGGQATPYQTGDVCGACESGYTTCTDSLCDDGSGDGFGTPSPTPPTMKPTDSPTPEPTVRSPTSTQTIPDDEPETDLGTNPSSCVILNSIYNSLNDVPFSADDTNGGTYPEYGPITAYNRQFYIRYDDSYNDWGLYDQDGNAYSYSDSCSADENCIVSSRSSWSNVLNGASVSDTAAAYSSSSTTKNKNSQLVEGLLIGVAITIGVFLISICIYIAVKRRNDKKNQYSVVEMNNEISNQPYVTMQN